jgi:hypothetical protein
MSWSIVTNRVREKNASAKTRTEWPRPRSPRGGFGKAHTRRRRGVRQKKAQRRCTRSAIAYFRRGGRSLTLNRCEQQVRERKVTRSIGSGYGYGYGYDGQMPDPQGMPLTGNAPWDWGTTGHAANRHCPLDIQLILGRMRASGQGGGKRQRDTQPPGRIWLGRRCHISPEVTQTLPAIGFAMRCHISIATLCQGVPRSCRGCWMASPTVLVPSPTAHDVSGVTADRKYNLKGISAALMALTCAELFEIDRGGLLHQSLAALEIRY